MTSLTNSLSDPLVKISLRHRHAQIVKNGATSHKTNYTDMCSEILNLEGHLNAVLVQQLRQFFQMGGFCLLDDLH